MSRSADTTLDLAVQTRKFGTVITCTVVGWKDTAQVVVNSPWLAEVRAINSVHSRYDPERWEAVKHFVFWFHDDTFECLAESLQFEVSTEELRNVIAGLKIRLVG